LTARQAAIFSPGRWMMTLTPCVDLHNPGFLRLALLSFCLASLPSLQLHAQAPAVPTSAQRTILFEQLARDADLLQNQNLLKRLVQLATPSVVHISAYKQLAAGSIELVEEAGSGVIVMVKDQPFIVTNRHVLAGAQLGHIDIKLHNGRPVYAAEVVGDASTDIAVIKLRDQPAAPKLIPARLGDSEKTEIGDFVVAVGSPFGLNHSVTYGIISAKGRRDLKLGQGGVVIQDFLQTDAAINPGNSGGPLLNLRGELIGINSAMASNSGRFEGIGFSIPVNMVMVVVKQLVEHGKIQRGYLGVRMDHQFRNETAHRLGLAHAQGVRVTGITANSPADKAGLQVNDVVLFFADTRLEDDNHLSSLVSLSSVGQRITLVVMRQRQQIKVVVKLGQRKEFEESP
jgi:serine protease Do